MLSPTSMGSESLTSSLMTSSRSAMTCQVSRSMLSARLSYPSALTVIDGIKVGYQHLIRLTGFSLYKEKCNRFLTANPQNDRDVNHLQVNMDLRLNTEIRTFPLPQTATSTDILSVPREQISQSSLETASFHTLKSFGGQMHLSKQVLIAVICKGGFLPSTETCRNKLNCISYFRICH